MNQTAIPSTISKPTLSHFLHRRRMYNDSNKVINDKNNILRFPELLCSSFRMFLLLFPYPYEQLLRLLLPALGIANPNVIINTWVPFIKTYLQKRARSSRALSAYITLLINSSTALRRVSAFGNPYLLAYASNLFNSSPDNLILTLFDFGSSNLGLPAPSLLGIAHLSLTRVHYYNI